MYNPSIVLYRRVIKTLRTKFTGDRKTYLEFKSSYKSEILNHKSLTDPIKISKVIFDFDVTREWLLSEVMRADLQQDGKYKLRIIKEQLQSIKVKPIKHPEYFDFPIPNSLIESSK